MTSADQHLFLLDVALLIQWAHANGYRLTAGNLYRTPEQNEAVAGSARSRHLERAAIDLNLFERHAGRWVYQPVSEAHRPLGRFWESLGVYNRWGGRYEDGNHYERLDAPLTEAQLE